MLNSSSEGQTTLPNLLPTQTNEQPDFRLYRYLYLWSLPDCITAPSHGQL